jgi:AmmeMemoRadiSam system protein B
VPDLDTGGVGDGAPRGDRVPAASEPSTPALRPLEVFPVQIDGRERFGLRDPSGLSESVLTVPRTTLAILALCDGTRSVGDVQADIMRRHGMLVSRDDIATLLRALDEHLFLESPRLQDHRTRVREAFAASPARPAFHAGKAYPAEAETLATTLDGFFVHPDGPGAVGPGRAPTLSGLVAPHIDFSRGGPAYAWAYQPVAEASNADCFIVLGTAHAGLDGRPFAATRKPYATPFGPVVVDDEVLDALARRWPEDLFAAELAHRAEHSIEFQAVWLAYLNRGRPVRMVPLLASFVHECLARGVAPGEDRRIGRMLDALRDTMAAVPRRYCLIAGADLAHVGPRFGDREPVSPATLRRIETEDRALLSLVAAVDPGGFFAAVQADGDGRRICGLSPIYALLSTLPAGRGRLLRYGQWPDPGGTVTFASLAFDTEGT